MGKRIFIAGATGFTGQALVRALLQRTDVDAIVAPVRASGGRLRDGGDPRLATFPLSLADERAVAAAMEGCEAVVQLIGTTGAQSRRGQGQGYEEVDLGTTLQLLAAARRAAVPRFLFLSSLGVSPMRRWSVIVPAEYFRVKHQAEEAVRSAPHAWTVWRPSFITGAGRARPWETAGVLALRPICAALDALGREEAAAQIRPITATELAGSMARVLFEPRPNAILAGRALWQTVPADAR